MPTCRYQPDEGASRVGQTSLGYLSSLPIHELKVDRNFVADMLDNPGHAAIVRSIVDPGHNLSLRVVGEGVEATSVLDRLRQLGCDEAQGFLVARPMPADQLLDWLTLADMSTGKGLREPPVMVPFPD
jgi:EAL domain-containing protein (putative c-di-GMP-specific phosphodiesterase class I)